MRDLACSPTLSVSGLISDGHIAMRILYAFPKVFLFPLVLMVLLAIVLTGVLVFSA